jgi:putative N6-adenine-specific DNA methylase
VKPSIPPNRLSAFAVTAPGLEAICARELATLGIDGIAEEGGVAWSGPLESVARANLWSRTASRVIVRTAEFRALTFFELERHANKVNWKRFVPRNGRVEFRVTCRKSKLYHSDAVAQRFARAVERQIPGAQIGNAAESDEDVTSSHVDTQLFIVRFVRDVCTLSVDTSGPLLHLRGYRQQVAKAPLRETLAAAVLLGAGWTGETPLDDPMCGSGTIPIEAACLARRIPPGINRSFAFLRWPETDPRMWTNLVSDARAAMLPSSPVTVSGADRDEGAIAAARANAERAGVSEDVSFSVRPISALPEAPAPGLVAVNPPYGVRVGDSKALRNLYAQLGNVMRRNRPGWTLALLSAETQLERQVQLPLEERLRTSNGGIPVRLMVAEAPRVAVPESPSELEVGEV